MPATNIVPASGKLAVRFYLFFGPACDEAEGHGARQWRNLSLRFLNIVYSAFAVTD
jgi:hypothetical protein